MRKSYHHLTEKDRVFLRIMLDKKYAKSKIAKILGVDRSTIYREIKRNSCLHWYSKKQFYWNSAAQEKYLKRRKRGVKLEKDQGLKQYVFSKLKCGWSPWQIEGRLKLEYADKTLITHETIYRYIYSDYAIRNALYQKLRRKHPLRVKQNARKSRIPKDMLITNRPDKINKREEFGHWEGDLMMFKQGIKGNLITLRERKTRYIIAIKNTDKTATNTAITLISNIKKLKNQIKSVTFDQGTEFSKHQWIKECFDATIYFCQPASPYQKGTIENANGIIRTELPRSYDVSLLKQKHLIRLVHEINNRPLKCLGYQTPQELSNQFVGR